MDSAELFKKQIRTVVRHYKLRAPQEYRLLCEAVAMHRASLKDPKFGTGDGQQRAVFEISERLQAALVQALSVEGVKWFNTKEGGRWFATTFKQFALPHHV
jgi:predicted ATPase